MTSGRVLFFREAKGWALILRLLAAVADLAKGFPAECFAATLWIPSVRFFGVPVSPKRGMKHRAGQGLCRESLERRNICL